MKTLDDYLRNIPLRNKDIAVVGPNDTVRDDPSLLYFANRMANQEGTLSVLDIEPHAKPESHGDYQTHMADFESMVHKGIRVKQPKVIIGDITKTSIEDRFDLVYDAGTSKCIICLKTTQSRRIKYTWAAEQVLNAYHKMLKPSGTALLVYPEGFSSVGYSTLIDLLKDDARFKWKLEPGFFTDYYEFRNINRQKVRSEGWKRWWNEEFSTWIKLNKAGYVGLGSKYKSMQILRIEKIK